MFSVQRDVEQCYWSKKTDSTYVQDHAINGSVYYSPRTQHTEQRPQSVTCKGYVQRIPNGVATRTEKSGLHPL